MGQNFITCDRGQEMLLPPSLTDWLPEDPQGAARVQRWLSVAAGPIAYGACAARLITVFGARFDAQEVIARAHVILGLIGLINDAWRNRRTARRANSSTSR